MTGSYLVTSVITCSVVYWSFSCLPCHPLNYYVENVVSYFTSNTVLERGLLMQEIDEIEECPCFNYYPSSIWVSWEGHCYHKNGTYCFAHGRRIKLKLPSYLIGLWREERCMKRERSGIYRATMSQAWTDVCKVCEIQPFIILISVI